MLKGLTLNFMSKFAGPFCIMKLVFKDVYKLDLQLDIKMHPTFHVSGLKPFKEYKQVIRPPSDLVSVFWNTSKMAFLNERTKCQKKHNSKLGEVARILWEKTLG